jgi:hypothetical protein
MAVRFCCDWCDKQLPIKVDGVDGKNKKITAELTYPKEIDIHEYFPHLCTSCARKIDIIVRMCEDRHDRKEKIVERYARINKARREQLGTKG